MKIYQVRNLTLAILVLCTLASCSMSRSIGNKAPIPENFGVYLTNTCVLDSSDFFQFQQHTQKVINSFNYEGNEFSLYLSDIDSNSIIIDIEKVKLSSPLRMAAGPVVTGLGLATLAVTLAGPYDFFFVFWYFPKNHSEVAIYFSKDLDEEQEKVVYLNSTPHNYQKKFEQMERQQEAYEYLLRSVFSDLSKEIRTGIRPVIRDGWNNGYE